MHRPRMSSWIYRYHTRTSEPSDKWEDTWGRQRRCQVGYAVVAVAAPAIFSEGWMGSQSGRVYQVSPRPTRSPCASLYSLFIIFIFKLHTSIYILISHSWVIMIPLIVYSSHILRDQSWQGTKDKLFLLGRTDRLDHKLTKIVYLTVIMFMHMPDMTCASYTFIYKCG